MEIKPQRFIATRNQNCLRCGFCEQYLPCAVSQNDCIGCGACVIACPQAARQLKPRTKAGSAIHFSLDGQPCKFKGPVSVRDALDELEKAVKGRLDDNRRNHDLCGTGGCWHCAVLIDGILARSCMTPLRQGMKIVTDPEILQQAEPKRIATLLRPAPHYHPSIFAHGCNYRCDLCHNWDMTFSATGKALNPAETVSQLRLDPEKDYWIGISGGEPTLNRKWLIETVRELRRRVPDSRIQLDTNASLLSDEYIDELVEAGITDISPDLKAYQLDTFMKVCAIQSAERARVYLENSWQAVRYINDNFREQVFMAASLPCHPKIHSRAELEEMAAALVKIDPELPVTLIELQPAFRRRDWPRISPKTMENALNIMQAAGLQRVIIQGGKGMPRAVDPLELALSTEAF
jgi:pyruvate formate lyase activating enzyme